MSNIDKRPLREAAEKATPGDWKYSTFDGAITDDTSSLAIVRMDSGHFNDEQSALNGAFIAAANPAIVLALLDELAFLDKRNAELNSTLERWAVDRAQSASEIDDAEKRIAELSHHLQSAHAFIEHTEAFGHAASNGILCCGDAQWNIDASKSVLAAAGKGE